MPTVTGTITAPDLAGRQVTVTFDVVDDTGQPVRAFSTGTDDTIVGPQRVTVTDGAYSVVLPATADLNPAGTRYRRRIHLPGGGTPVDDYLIVPSGGGPYVEEDILAGPLDPLPTTTPSNERDYDEITVDNANLTLVLFQMLPVPNLVVTVPDLTRPCHVMGQVNVSHAVANANVSLLVGVTGLGTGAFTSTLGAGSVQLAAANSSVVTATPFGRVPAGSPGDYQLYATGTAGNLLVRGAGGHKSSLRVLEV